MRCLLPLSLLLLFLVRVRIAEAEEVGSRVHVLLDDRAGRSSVEVDVDEKTTGSGEVLRLLP